MKNSIFLGICVFIASIAIAQKPAPVLNNKSGWHKITETRVNFEKETDEVNVMIADKFAALKFKVTNASIELNNLDVYFEDGSSQNIVIGKGIKKEGESSPEIDIPGAEEKRIDKIVLRYRTLKPNNAAKTQNPEKAQVEIWGKKTNSNKKDDKKSGKKEAR